MAEPETSQTFGISKEILKCVVSNKHRNDIASKIGDAWESLATFIGVPPEDVHDIKEEYRKPLDRRLAMMRRWHELWGSEATYRRLVEGLRQIGRRDLIEFLKQKAHLPSASGSKLLLVCDAAFVAVVTIIFVGAFNYYNTYNAVPIHNISESGTNQQHLTKNTTHPSKTVEVLHQIVSDCSSPESDLPIIHPLFVGRENDVHQVLLKVAKAHIVNINGAPGFGKSTLAIHVGYEVVKNGTSVRYINMEDKMFSIVNQWQRSEGKAKPEFMSKNDVHPGQMTSLIKPSRSSVSNNYQTMSSEHNNIIMHGDLEELQKWSKEMKCTNVLILDNCDDVLISEYRQEFLILINTLVINSMFKLHIIIVSQQRLLYLDDFDCWTVKELNYSASIEMLDRIAPAIDNETLQAAAELVEGCPLALKVIGQLLHIHGVNLTSKLKNEVVITILDDASIPKHQFRTIMDVAFERLGILKNCGYILSLFPGSFDEQAATAIVQKECLELYFKHSLLNEYLFAYDYRYKMHRLIKEYLQEKISIGENTTFMIKFQAYFKSWLLDHAMSQENDKLVTEKYSLSFELHNLNYLKELLLTDMHLSPKELAVLGLLSDMDLIQFEQLHRYYAIYILNVQEICQLLNNQKLCGKMYSTIVRHLYQKCKCETTWAYLQNFFKSPCMEYFQCKVVRYLDDLETYGVKLYLSQDASSYIDIILGSHCNEVHRIQNHFITFKRFLTSFLGTVSTVGSSIILLNRRVFLNHFCMDCIIAILLCIVCACMIAFIHIVLFYDIAVINTHHQFLRMLEITSKVLCPSAILLFAIIFITTFILSRVRNYYSGINDNKLTMLFTFTSVIVQLISLFLPAYYCCQFIPLCI